MSSSRTSAKKRNAYSIRGTVSQAIFKQFLTDQGGAVLKGTLVGRFDRPMLSALANIATKAIMNEPGVDVVLKKQG